MSRLFNRWTVPYLAVFTDAVMAGWETGQGQLAIGAAVVFVTGALAAFTVGQRAIYEKQTAERDEILARIKAIKAAGT